MERIKQIVLSKAIYNETNVLTKASNCKRNEEFLKAFMQTQNTMYFIQKHYEKIIKEKNK